MNDCIHLLLSTYEMVSHSYICNSSCVLSKSCVTLFPCCLFCQIWLLLIYAFPCLGRKQKEACYSNPYPYLYKNCPAIAMCQQLNNFLFFIFLTIYFLFFFVSFFFFFFPFFSFVKNLCIAQNLLLVLL